MNERDKHVKALTKFYMSSDDTVKEETLEAIRFALKEIAANKEVANKEVANKEPRRCKDCAKFHQGWFCSHFQAKSQSDGFCHAFTELPF